MLLERGMIEFKLLRYLLSFVLLDILLIVDESRVYMMFELLRRESLLP